MIICWSAERDCNAQFCSSRFVKGTPEKTVILGWLKLLLWLWLWGQMQSLKNRIKQLTSIWLRNSVVTLALTCVVVGVGVTRTDHNRFHHRWTLAAAAAVVWLSAWLLPSQWRTVACAKRANEWLSERVSEWTCEWAGQICCGGSSSS